jgi:hypothetical protein
LLPCLDLDPLVVLLLMVVFLTGTSRYR